MTRHYERCPSEADIAHTTDAGEYAWPIAAHPVFSPAFPLCGMMLRPSGEGTLLAALLGIDERGRRSGVEPVSCVPALPHRAA